MNKGTGSEGCPGKIRTHILYKILAPAKAY